MKTAFSMALCILACGTISNVLAADSPSRGRQTADSQAVFQVLDVDPGDRAWGSNCMKVRVRNTTDQARRLFIHIGARMPTRGGFGMGENYTVEPGEQLVEHWYWIPPDHGTFQAKVKFTVATTSEPFNEEPFLAKVYTIKFNLPNDRCNDLMVADRIPGLRKFYPADMRRIEPFQHRKSEHFVLYYSPDTPAARDIDNLAKQHEAAMAEVVEFLGVQPRETIIIFFYPDRLTKRMCTNHQGDGMADGNLIAQVYNEQTTLDATHEIMHIVAARVGSPPALFNEGLATWTAKDHVWLGKPVDATARELLKAGRLVPLKELLKRTEIGARPDDGEVAYPQSASVVGFLINTYGKRKFLEAYASLKVGDEPRNVERNIARMQEVFGEPIERVEAAWRGTLIE